MPQLTGRCAEAVSGTLPVPKDRDLPRGHPSFIASANSPVIHFPTLDRAKAEFSGFAQGDGLVAPPQIRDRDVVSDRAVWPFLVVISTPGLQLVDRVGKCQKPVRVQAFGAEPTVERFNEGIVRGFAGP